MLVRGRRRGRGSKGEYGTMMMIAPNSRAREREKKRGEVKGKYGRI